MGTVLRLPSSRVLKACRQLAGVGSNRGTRRAVRTVVSALDQGIDRDLRLAAAQVLAKVKEPSVIRRTYRAIRDPRSRLAVAQAPAAIILGRSDRRLSYQIVEFGGTD